MAEDKQIKQAYQNLADIEVGWRDFLVWHVKYREQVKKSLRIKKSMVKINTPQSKIVTALEIIKQAPRNSWLRNTLNKALRSKFGKTPNIQYKAILRLWDIFLY